jgi:hypothetical protein
MLRLRLRPLLAAQEAGLLRSSPNSYFYSKIRIKRREDLLRKKVHLLIKEG